MSSHSTVAAGALAAELLQRFGQLVASARRILLTGPGAVDGDSLGAALGLAEAIEGVHPGVEVIIAYDGPIPRRYGFLPQERYRHASQLSGHFDVAVVLDGDRGRLGAAGSWFEEADSQVLIDHHRSSDPGAYTLALFDPDAASTCELVYQIAQRGPLSVPLTTTMATALYTGLVYDTGTFRFSCTRPLTLRIAAELIGCAIPFQRINEDLFLNTTFEARVFRGRVLASAQRHEGGQVAWALVPHSLLTACRVDMEATEGIVNDLVFLEGVEAAFLVIEPSPGALKLSFRSRGRVNVAQAARAVDPSGGGHDRAAGVNCPGTIPEVEARALAAVLSQLEAVPG